jgi:hypothetical protein
MGVPLPFALPLFSNDRISFEHKQGACKCSAQDITFNLDALRRLGNVFCQLQAVYIIQTTLPLYISNGRTAKLWLDFKSFHVEKCYTVLATIVCTENNVKWNGKQPSCKSLEPKTE